MRNLGRFGLLVGLSGLWFQALRGMLLTDFVSQPELNACNLGAVIFGVGAMIVDAIEKK